MTPALSVFILTSVLATSFLSGILGMAGGMVLMGLLTWQLSVQEAMILHAIAQFSANVSRAAIHRRHVHASSMRYYFAGMAVMFAGFSLSQVVPSKEMIFFLMGLSPFAARALPKNLQLDFAKPRHSLLCGMIVTFFQLTSGTGGPMLDVFFQSRSMTRHEAVATKAFAMSASHVTKFVYFSMVVSTVGESFRNIPLWLCAIIVPAALAGTHCGKYVLDKLDDRLFYRITQGVLLTIGMIYLAKAAMLWLAG